MKKFLLFISFAAFFFHVATVYSSDIEDKENQIQELEKKVNSLHTQAKTLADQIAYFDSQIQLTSLKISQTETLITTISDKINTLESKLQSRAVVLEKQIVQTYKHGQVSPLELLLASGNFSDVMSAAKYLQTVQDNSRKFLHDTQLVQSSYAEQKKLMQDSRKRLEIQKTNLDSLKADKDNLLKQTRNDEVLYQKQLQAAKLELEAIRQALAAGKKEGPVKKGDPIALMGNSGYPSCSTGAHLHFEVRVNDQWVNAESYVQNRTDKYGLTVGSGKWDWPMKGDIYVTQRYGKTPYSYVYLYSGGIHTGIDMVSDNKVVYAPDDGTLYSYTGKCGSSNLNIKYIEHGNGLTTLYLHVQ